MITKTVYIADDGKQFNTRNECLNYEYNSTHLPDCVTLYDEKRMPMEPEGKEKCIDAYMEAIYVEVVSLKNYESEIKETNSRMGINLPSKPGFYAWEPCVGWLKIAEKWTIFKI